MRARRVRAGPVVRGEREYAVIHKGQRYPIRTAADFDAVMAMLAEEPVKPAREPDCSVIIDGVPTMFGPLGGLAHPLEE